MPSCAASPTVVRDLIAQHSRSLMDDVLPALAERGVTLHQSLDTLSREDRGHLDAYFQSNVFPVLTPLAVDPGHPFPYISNLSLSIAVVLRGPDGEERFARVKVPKIIPRWVPLLAPNTLRTAGAGDRVQPRVAVPGRGDPGLVSLPHHPEHRPADRDRRRGRGPAQSDSGGGAQPAFRRGRPDRSALDDAGLASAAVCSPS